MRRIGRKISTAEQRAAWVEKFHQSGLSQREFVSRHGLSLTTFQSWLYRKASPRRRSSPSAVRFHELKLSRAPMSGSIWAVEIEAGSTAKVRVGAGVDPQWVGQILRQLAPAC